jgi:hypothetical protein
MNLALALARGELGEMRWLEDWQDVRFGIEDVFVERNVGRVVKEEV